MARSIKLDINRANNIKAFTQFFENRRSKARPQFNSVNTAGITSIYDDFVEPMLQLWSNPKSKITEADLIDFMGEVFALAIYSKGNVVSNWRKDPKLVNNLTPDFIINEASYIEVYSPEIDFWKNVSGDGGFQPATELLQQSTIIDTVGAKSSKYNGYPMIILVMVHNYPFPDDLPKIYKSIKNRPEHRIVGMYGDSIIYDSSTE